MFPPPKLAPKQQEPIMCEPEEPDENIDSSNLIEEVYLNTTDGMTCDALDKHVVDDTYLDDFLHSKLP
jgi:hypothetical protein